MLVFADTGTKFLNLEFSKKKLKNHTFHNSLALFKHFYKLSSDRF